MSPLGISLLMLVAFLPFPTKLMAQAIDTTTAERHHARLVRVTLVATLFQDRFDLPGEERLAVQPPCLQGRRLRHAGVRLRCSINHRIASVAASTKA